MTEAGKGERRSQVQVRQDIANWARTELWNQVPIDISVIDISDNKGPNPDAPFFRFNKKNSNWIFNLRTEDLPIDRYEITIRINDVKDYHTGFELR